MTGERKKILEKVNGLIEKRKKELLIYLPSFEEINDNIVIKSNDINFNDVAQKDMCFITSNK